MFETIFKALIRDQQIIIQGNFPEFMTWRTIRVGTYKTVSDLIKDLEQSSVDMQIWVKDMLMQSEFELCKEESELELVQATLNELGLSKRKEDDPHKAFVKDLTLKEIYIRAIQLGLDLCPPEVGPQLQLQYDENLPFHHWGIMR